MSEDGRGGDPKTIVVVQRDTADQEFIRVFLDRIGGFRVIDAGSATDVIHKLKMGPDLILVDTRMEGDFIRAVELMRRMPHLNHVGIDTKRRPECHQAEYGKRF